MLKLVTQKLKSQSLNEASSFETQISYLQAKDASSDDVVDVREVATSELTGKCDDKYVCERVNACPYNRVNAGHYEFFICNKENVDVAFCENCKPGGGHEASCCKSLSHLVKDCFECAERKRQFNPLKRPCLRISPCSSPEEKRRSHCARATPLSDTSCADSSSDDEIKNLCSRMTKSNSSGPAEKISVLSASPRARNSHQDLGNIYISHARPSSRPSVNFEKMYLKFLKKQRPKAIRIKAVRSTRAEDNCPSVEAFKPINALGCSPSSMLPPVEEPLLCSL